ncbi:UNVERIFIED_CONTAM: Asparagine--tRNA ligase, cytoplasmic 1, partial [Sesamum indicum]
NIMSVAAQCYKATLAVTTGLSAPLINLAVIYKQQAADGRYLTEEKFKAYVIVYNHPKAIKACYAKVNEDDKTDAAMDVLVGKLIGCIQKEENYDILKLSYQVNVFEVATRRNITAMLEAGALKIMTQMMIKESKSLCIVIMV